MHSDHPNQRTLVQFRSGELPAEESREVTSHLHRCGPCRRLLADLGEGGSSLAGALAELQPPEPAEAGSYDSIISRTYGVLLQREAELERDRLLAPQLVQELAQHPPARQRVLIANTQRFQSWGLAERLLADCAESWFQDPAGAETLAELALAVAEALQPAQHSVKLLHDLQARCWIHLANSRRVCSGLRAAEDAFRSAETHLAQGTGDPLERAHLLRFKASLRRDQRAFDEAESLLTRALNTYRRIGDPHLAGKAMLNQGNLYKAMGEPERAIEVLARAVPLIDPERDPLLHLGTRHNLIDYLADAGRYMEARAQLAQARSLYEQLADPAMRRRWMWVQGRVAFGLGQLDRAETLLSRVRQDYLAQSQAYDAALASLELAMVYARRGRAPEMKALAEEMITVFQALEIQREAMAALLLFREAAEAEQVTLALLQEIAGRIRGSRDSSLSHHPA